MELRAPDKGGRRSGVDRRQFAYSSYIPERRIEQGRRSGFDRRVSGDRRGGSDRRKTV